MKFGEYIRQKREGKGWTQPAAAQQADIEQSYLSKLETGKSYPSEGIFDKLVEAYGIDSDEMTQLVESQELQKLTDIKSVRFAILGHYQRGVTTSRNWMIAGLLSLMVGGASLGAAMIPGTADRKFQYRSEGVLLQDEALTAFASIHSTDNNRRETMLERLDQIDQVLSVYRGDNFVDTTPEGRRFYELYAEPETSGHSPMRLFIIPALMFLFGSLGCFLIGFRWRQRS